MTIDITIWRLVKKVQTSKEYIKKMVECLVYFIYVCANLDIDGFNSRKFVFLGNISNRISFYNNSLSAKVFII